ncbi:MAG: hypothetical protein PF517_02240 [Salinivirgaceae bacterium]|jgi:hypothetical protein|nr:hypothetical protein [Salinivirgaceae bacterium]
MISNKIYIPLVFLITVLITIKSGFSQDLNHEKVYVHVNRNILLSGSDLKYSAYISNEHNTEVSTIVYFKLIDCYQTPILHWNSPAYNNTVSGIHKIPETIENGQYYLLAYTNKMRNYPIEALNTTPLIIQRIYEDAGDSICIEKSLSKFDTAQAKLSWNKNKLLNIEVVNNADFSIALNPTKDLKIAQLSISVTELSNLNSVSSASNFMQHTKQVNSYLRTNNIEPLPIENGYSILSGQLLRLPDSVPVSSKLVYLAYPDSSVHFKHFETNAKGEFCFLLDSTFMNKQLYLQMTDADCHKDSITWLVDKKELLNISAFNPKNIGITPDNMEYITQLQKREIVQRVYHSSQISENNEPNNAFVNNFFQTPSYITKPSDYIELSNFQDICDNILPSIRFRVVNHKVEIGMVINQDVIFENVLICVNGLPCFNMNYIENLSSKDIKRIETFNSVLMHGNLTYNGVIAIYTHKNQIDDRAFCNPNISLKNKYHRANTNSKISSESNLPKVTPDIYWNESVKIDSEPKTIHIRKPELGANYKVEINGLINNITPFSYEKTIKIK